MTGIDLIDAAVREHAPSHVFALFSGGHDSLCATHIAAQHPAFSGCVHVNTGIGVERTREFVRETCRRHGWPLLEVHPPALTYRDLILRFGFPGPGQHSLVYRFLKERAIDRVISTNKTRWNDRIVLVNGARHTESQRRMRTINGPVRRDGCSVWVAPIYGWDATDRLPYIERHGLARNPVVDALHMSGECLCGAFAQPGEIETIGGWFPEVAAQISALEDEVAARGLPCRWGHRPPRRPHKAQLALPGWNELVAQVGRARSMPLCASCAPGRGLVAAGMR